MVGNPTSVAFSPDTIVQRQSGGWRGIAVENVQVTRQEPFEYRLQAPYHLLIASHRAERRDGETFVEGLPRSTRREFNRRLTFVPAGHEFRGWQDPCTLTRVTYFYIDPQGPLLDPEFVALAGAVPSRLKHRKGLSKYILRQALSGMLPDDILKRPKKGFGIPVD